MLSHWKPFYLSTNGLGAGLQREMERAFSDFTRPAQRPELAAPADVVETKEAILVRLDLPGMDAKELQVTIDKDVLTIQAERKLPPQTDETYHRAERTYGKLTRSFALPTGVDGTRIEARYENGVLAVSLPKRDEVKPRTISVKVG